MPDDEKTSYTAEEVEQIKNDLISKHNGEMAKMRKSHETEINNMKLSEEERVAKEKEEHDAEIQQELNDLREFKKATQISELLTKNNLPLFFKNDTRLLSAKDDKELASVIKTIQGEYANSMPKGATHSTVVNGSQSTENNKPNSSDFDNMIRDMASR